MLRVTEDLIISHEVDEIVKTNTARNNYFYTFALNFFLPKHYLTLICSTLIPFKNRYFTIKN